MKLRRYCDVPHHSWGRVVRTSVTALRAQQERAIFGEFEDYIKSCLANAEGSYVTF